MKVPDLSKLPKKKVAIGAAALAAVLLLMDDVGLHSNLKSSTQITRNLREELEQLRNENKTFQDKVKTEQTERESMSAELSHLKQDKDSFAEQQAQLQKQVQDAEGALSGQNKKIKDLERKLKDADDQVRRQRKASANLEEQTRSAKANPGVTKDYVKIVESEWLTAVTKTQQLKKDLDRTLTELAGQNKEREKMRSETATMHYNLAVILTQQQNYPAAILEYQKVLEMRPNDADAHYNLAILYDDYMKDNDRALEHYRQYVRVAPDSPESQRVRQWIKDKEFDTTFKFKL